MTGNYHLDSSYAQERIAALYHEAKNQRLARQGKEEGKFGSVFAAAANKVAIWIGQVTSQAAQSLEKLGETRVEPLHEPSSSSRALSPATFHYFI